MGMPTPSEPLIVKLSGEEPFKSKITTIKIKNIKNKIKDIIGVSSLSSQR
ncbi:MAG: hypothetical protein JRN32_03000 [Nitrososphaerota archaeon]|jgi:hypothetical protein|nr:hypothetical protein [Nitrososphaerota archaeon]